MSQVLLVEDDLNLQKSLSEFLRGEGYEVSTTGSFEEALTKSPKRFEAIILDWMLNGKSGIDLLKKWRREGEETPVILLTAKSDLVDKILGLELGADDYLTKPFEPRELLARIRVQTRKAASTLSVPTSSRIRLNPDTKEVKFDETPIELTKMEYHLLKLFIENPNKVFSRDELLNQVWGYDSYPTTRTVDTHILQLRQKLSPELFETIRGMGYRYHEVLQ